MEIIFFIVMSIVWPFRSIFQMCSSKYTSKRKTSKQPYLICQESLRQNIHDGLLWASSKNYTDMWTRDTFFACMGMDSSAIFVDVLAHFQRDDGLIPLYVGQGDAFCKLFCGQRPSGPIKPTYEDAKTGDCPTDSCFQFIIMAIDIYPEHCKKAWAFMQRFVRDGLIYEHGLGTWQDTIKHRGYVAYTNILYYQATKLLYPAKARLIQDKIIDTFWTGRFFKCSSTNQSFGQVDNALALIYEIVPDIAILVGTYRREFDALSPPNKMLNTFNSTAFSWYNVYLPCYVIGNASYHNGWAWSWPWLLMQKALKQHGYNTNLRQIEDWISTYGTLHETYDVHGPVRRVWYSSQPNFSEACGLYLDVVSKPLKLKSSF